MNDQTDPTQKSTPTGPGSSASPGSLSAGASTGSESASGTGTGTSAGSSSGSASAPSLGAKMGSSSGSDTGSGYGGSSPSRNDYSSSAGDEPSFDGTAASLESLPIGEAMHEMLEMTRQLVREHPLAAVAAGVLVGMVLGRR